MFDWTLSVVERGGYVGVFALMALENIFPPIPSEVILPLVGFSAAEGRFSFVVLVLVAASGAVAGCLPWYVLGRAFGVAHLQRLAGRYGRWFTFSPRDVERAGAWFVRHGRTATLVGRLIPTVRTLISVPAGIARMPLGVFFLYSFVGSALWSALLAFFGYILQSQYRLVAAYLNPVSNAIIVLMVAGYLYRVVTFRAEGESDE